MKVMNILKFGSIIEIDSQNHSLEKSVVNQKHFKLFYVLQLRFGEFKRFVKKLMATKSRV